IAGATDASYQLQTATATDAGSYSVSVANTCGNVTAQAQVLVITPPVIVAQPRTQEANLADTGTFVVKATGAQLIYQWHKNGNDIIGATDSVLALSNLQSSDAG